MRNPEGCEYFSKAVLNIDLHAVNLNQPLSFLPDKRQSDLCSQAIDITTGEESGTGTQQGLPRLL